MSIRILALVFAPALACVGAAQVDAPHYPSKPLRIVDPRAPGA